MEVSGSSEVGISPVLLQAINQLQKSKQAQVALTGSHISGPETLQAVSGKKKVNYRGQLSSHYHCIMMP